jgi:hypothetical protein
MISNNKVSLEVNSEKTKYMLMSHHQNVGQNHDIKMGNRCFENVAQFRYLGMTVTNQNLIQEEIKMRLNLGNACYHSVQNLLSSDLLSRHVKIRLQNYNFNRSFICVLNFFSDVEGRKKFERALEQNAETVDG